MQELHEHFEIRNITHTHMQEPHTGFEYEQYGKQNSCNVGYKIEQKKQE